MAVPSRSRSDSKVGSRAWLALVVAAPLAASLGVFGACSSGDAASPTVPAPLDAAPVADSGAPDAPPVLCTPVDIKPGTGKKFCDLPGEGTTELVVPPELCVREFTTTPVPEARVLRFAPNGDLFVAAPSMPTVGGAANGAGAIVVLPDDDGDGRADSVVTFAGPSPHVMPTCAALEADPSNLACVHGLLFADGYLYFTRSDEVRRIPHVPGARTAGAGTSELVATLGGAAFSDARWTHTLEQHKDGSIYVSRGRLDTADCNPAELARGAVFALHVEGKASLPVTPELQADGFRNPMYLRCAPNSCGDCYASELTGDGWDGVAAGREKIALLGKKGESWGYPCCVGRGVPAPGFASHDCGSVGRELVPIPLHDTPFGLDFDRGGFPEPYRHGLFIALHGVITSFGGTGVVWVKTDPITLRPMGEPTMFVKGFGRSTGRATDVVFAPDGRMFIADDTSGKIFWVAPRTLAAPR